MNNKDLASLCQEYYNKVLSKNLILESLPESERLAKQDQADINAVNKATRFAKLPPWEQPGANVDKKIKHDTEEFSSDDMKGLISADDRIEKPVTYINKPQNGRAGVDSKLPIYTYKHLMMAINRSFAMKAPLLILGDPGVGKTEIVKQVSKQIAEYTTVGEYIQPKDLETVGDEIIKYKKQEEIESGQIDKSQNNHRYFVNWNELKRKEDKEYVINHADEFFILMDKSMAEVDRLDMGGVPDVASSKNKKPGEIEYMNTLLNLDLTALTTPGLEGILFLDELNLATKDVQKIFLKLFERKVGNTELSSGIAIVAASNIPGEGVDSDALSAATLNRMGGGIGVLVADPNRWCDWALDNGVDERIVMFIKENSADFFYSPTPLEELRDRGGQFPTPRSLVAFSRLYVKTLGGFVRAKKKGIRHEGKFLEFLLKDIPTGLGVDWAIKFVQWLKEVETFELDKILQIKNLGRKGRADDVTLSKIGKIVYSIKGRLVSAIRTLEREGLDFKKLLDLDENELIQFYGKTLKQDHQKSFVFVEAAALIISRLHTEWSITLAKRLDRELTPEQIAFFMQFLEFGDYDQEAKDEIMRVSNNPKEMGGVFQEMEKYLNY